ncbi:hypothetical protein Z045_09130 [Rhodococcus pyridinivorans KG-16]|uniref:Protein NO VEIN C-terminal domain-containing protein n=1 Tax=Rhodococcus pyridinivorans KG-16 TaxID=1441730 RepID=A0A0V9ULD6_9NOCA|nr:DUF3883 domain-containing protein [Rhodococcus pyridinivorans]KSZ58796.1 hypothetical protein Z045_09130 [Rhodococcus pyridinivorans KG-16]
MSATDLFLHQLQDTLIDEHLQAPGLFREIARMEGLLAETYRNRVPYELLQNSDDAGSSTVTVVESPDGTFSWSNDGRVMDGADIESLCRSASSTKTRGDASIGYRGIGFKSLAAVASKIEVRSGDVTFSFDKALAAELLREQALDSVPLIRIPVGIEQTPWLGGASFTVTRTPDAGDGLGELDPISLLFLRNVRTVLVRSRDDEMQVSIERANDRVVVRSSGSDADFAILREGAATVAVPMNTRALALTRVRGRLACFLPLNDEVGLPVIISGDMLTDPSRTHAVVADESTTRVLRDAARAIAYALRNPGTSTFERLWELILQGEDIRSLLVSATGSASQVLLSSLRDEMMEHRPSFKYSSVVLEEEDVSTIFPGGAPAALYSAANQAAARTFKAVLGLETLDLSALADEPVASQLSEQLRTRLGKHFQDLARAHGRSLTPTEQALVELLPAQESQSVTSEVEVSRPSVLTSANNSMGAVMTQWRTAEVATMQYLNGRGWSLRDVSTQNVGYDLEGTDSSGQRVNIEVKKVDSLDARFALTNNEMSLMLNSSAPYLLAIVVGSERHSKLMILDPSRPELSRERVCRRWDWEFTDWGRFAVMVD